MPFWAEEALLGVRLAYKFFFFPLQISRWFVLGRHSATWSWTSLLSLGSSEAPEVLPLSTATAVTLVTSALLIDLIPYDSLLHSLCSSHTTLFCCPLNSKHTPASGALYLLFPVTRMPMPQISTWYIFTRLSSLFPNATLTWKSSLTSYLKPRTLSITISLLGSN